MNPARLLDRFLRYIEIESTADDSTDKYPSSPGQLEIGRVLAQELREMGAADVEHDEHGLVWATIPATVVHQVPVIAFNAHVDTSPETTAQGVRPQVIRNYPGGDIPLPGDPSKIIRVTENPVLDSLRGHTIVTTDGTTLLGADDKAGVAVIMEATEHLLEHPEIPHGKIRVLFTCDEEIGRGAQHFDPNRLGAKVCYTLDGQGTDEIDVETFSAFLATVTIQGVNIHPSIAKGRMVNALRIAAAFLSRLPQDTLSPETTDGREGFMHPYQIDGGVAQVRLRILLREFDHEKLQRLADQLQALAAEMNQQFPGGQVDVRIRHQYSNMAEGLKNEPRAVAYAQEAHRRLGRTGKLTIVRGGTDGSQFTALGVPTPNLSTGEHNPHSPLEWTCLEEMQQAVEVLIELAQVWACESAS